MANVKQSPGAKPNSKDESVWTAREFFGAFAPQMLRRLHDAEAMLQFSTLQAHATAVHDGLDWNRNGRYPVSVWMQVG